MSVNPPDLAIRQIDRLAEKSSALGSEIVDIAGFLDLLERQAQEQRAALKTLAINTREMTRANADSNAILEALIASSGQTERDVSATAALMRSMGDKTREVAGWVKSVRERAGTVDSTLKAVTDNNSQIAAIAAQVNTLAINAKIEAARAGDAGRGFAVVADAINDLSQKTGTAAKQISENIESLTGWISDLGREAGRVSTDADAVLRESHETDAALGRMETTVRQEQEQSARISAQTERVEAAVAGLQPAVKNIERSAEETSGGIERAHARIARLIETSEQIVQLTAAIGGTTRDAPFIAFAQKTAQAVSQGLDHAIAEGRISTEALFDRVYTPVPGTAPEQVVTRATEFLDQFLPRFQEPALDFDPSVVFCAAVDINGYLPTHNRKFSHPQGADPVWNTAHCRNRRIFDDRVGLKAGRSRAPFLLQVYRRDMGGGDFQMMKDLSAPIAVNGQHWGGLRLAYQL